MEIREIMYERRFVMETENPYLAALDVTKKLSGSLKITENKNVYETDGPHHRSEIILTVREKIDGFARTIFIFSFVGENRTLEINLEGRFEAAIKEPGFFSETFAQFYMSRTFPLFRKQSEMRIKEIASFAEAAVAAARKISRA